MKVLVTGVNGQLGHDMMLELKRRNHEPTGSGSGPEYRGSDSVAAMPYEQMTITDAENVQAVLRNDKVLLMYGKLLKLLVQINLLMLICKHIMKAQLSIYLKIN